jgi:hypothetical protein
MVAKPKKTNGRRVCEVTGTLQNKNSSVDRENKQSRISCPIEAQRRSAIYFTVRIDSKKQGKYIDMYFECVKDDIQFDGVLSTDGVVYLACIGEGDKYKDGNYQEECAQNVGFLRWREWRGRRGKKVCE